MPIVRIHSNIRRARCMHSCRDKLLVSVLLAAIVGCSNNVRQQPNNNTETNVQSSSPGDTKVDPPNEFGFAKISFRVGDIYRGGIADVQGKELRCIHTRYAAAGLPSRKGRSSLPTPTPCRSRNFNCDRSHKRRRSLRNTSRIRSLSLTGVGIRLLNLYRASAVPR